MNGASATPANHRTGAGVPATTEEGPVSDRLVEPKAQELPIGLEHAVEERLAELLEFLPDGYVETDELGKIIEANPAATRLLGVPAGFVEGQSIHLFVSPDDRQRLCMALAQLADGAPVRQTLVQLTPRNGPMLWAEMRIGGHHDPVTGTPRVRWLIRDVDERMKLERRLTQLHVSVDLLTALSEVNRLVEDDDMLTSVLRQLVELAHEVVDADAGVMVTGADGKTTVRAAAGPSTDEICELQLARGGPAMQTQRDGVPRSFAVDELGACEELAGAARRHGIKELVSHPIRNGDEVIGTFNLYVRGDVGDAAQLAKLLAENAAASIYNAQVYAGARSLAMQLATALESRGVIDQAKGVLMVTQHCGPDEAFDILRRASQRQNRKLRVIAEEVVATATHRNRSPGRRPAD